MFSDIPSPGPADSAGGIDPCSAECEPFLDFDPVPGRWSAPAPGAELDPIQGLAPIIIYLAPRLSSG